MKIWTVANQKGGVGKTTTTVTLGGSLALRGYRTLLIDMDPHGSLTSYFGHDPDTIEEGVYTLFHRQVRDARMPMATMLRKTREPLLDFLPASTALIALERQIGTLQGKGLVVRDFLQRYRNHYQYVIIDCPPSLGILMINALAACDQLIIPVQTEFLAIQGLRRMLNTLDMLAQSGKSLPEYRVLPTMYDKRTRASRDSLQYLQSTYADVVSDSYIPVDTNFREASRAGRPLGVLTPGSRGVKAYEGFISSLLDSQFMDYKEAI